MGLVPPIWVPGMAIDIISSLRGAHVPTFRSAFRSAQRSCEDCVGALEDLDLALQIEPDNPFALPGCCCYHLVMTHSSPWKMMAPLEIDGLPGFTY